MIDMMNLPQGSVQKLQYRSVGPRLASDVLRIHIRSHMDTYEAVDLPNNGWNVHNPALQFIALQGWRPSDFSERGVLEPDFTMVPLAPVEDGWGLSQIALKGGEQALREAKWFGGASPSDDEERDAAPTGGGSPDPGTGNRGGVEDASDPDVNIGLAEQDADAGIEVSIE
jgi:hypothetical protein